MLYDIKYFDVKAYDTAVNEIKLTQNSYRAIKKIIESVSDEKSQIYMAIELIRYTANKSNKRTYYYAIEDYEKLISIIERKLDMIDKNNEDYTNYYYLYEYALYKLSKLRIAIASSRFEFETVKYVFEKIIDNKYVVNNVHYLLAEAKAGLAVCEKRMGNIDKARKQLETIIKEDNIPDARLELGYLEYEADNWDRAKELFESLKSDDEDLCPYQKLVHISLSKIYKAKKDGKNAIRELDELIIKNPGFKRQALLEKGKIYYTVNNDFDNATKCFNDLLDVAKTSFDKIAAYNELAIIQKLNGNYAEAIDYCNKCKKIEHDNQYVNIVLGEIYELKNEHDKALDLYYEVFKKGNSGDKSEAARKLVKPYYEANDFERLEELVDFLINSKKVKDRNLGYYYKFLKEHYLGCPSEEAMEYCEKIEGEISSFSRVYDYLAYGYAKNRDIDKLQALVNQANKSCEKPDFVLYFNILLKVATNDLKDIDNDIDKLIEYDAALLPAQLYHIAKTLDKSNYRLANKLYDAVRSYDSNYHYMASVFYAMTYNVTSTKDIKYHIDLVNSLLENEACDELTKNRLLACLSKTYTIGGYYNEAIKVCEDLKANNDPFYHKLADVRLGAIYRINGDFEKSIAIIEKYIDDPSISELAFVQYVKNYERLDMDKAYELVSSKVEESPNYYLHYEYAKMLINKEEYDKAKEILFKLINNKKSCKSFLGLCYTSLAYIERINGNMDAYEEYNKLACINYPLVYGNNAIIDNDDGYILDLK